VRITQRGVDYLYFSHLISDSSSARKRRDRPSGRADRIGDYFFLSEASALSRNE
jgi:hypothetical protein